MRTKPRPRSCLLLAALALWACLATGCEQDALLTDDLGAARAAMAERNWPLAERLLERYLREERNPDQRWEAWQQLLSVVNSANPEARATLEYLEVMLAEFADDDARTKEAWHDGYYHTGDTAWEDEHGYFWFVGRTDDVIKSSGYRIGPFEVESALIEHPAVLECAITGVPDPVRGQVVKATVILAKGYEPSEELKKELQDHVKHTTAPYKYPRIVEFVEELPKTISGKIRRVEIRENDK